MRLSDEIFYRALRGEIPQGKTDTDPVLPDDADVATTDYSRDLKAIQLMHDLAHRLTRACEYYAKKWDLELTDAWTGPEPEGVPEKQLVHYFTRLGPVGLALQEVEERTRTQVIEKVRAAFDPYVHGTEVRFSAAC